MKSPFITIEQALVHLQQGQMIILVDDEDRENEGDLIIGAEFITADAINFMSRFGRGLICLSMDESFIDRLNLPMMSINNRSPFRTPFTISIEAATGVSTGISAKDRAHTIKVAIDPESGPMDVISPGHIFPLRANPKGVLARGGQTEGSVDLMKLAGLAKAAVICEVINDDGTMSRRDQLAIFSKEHSIPMVTIKDLLDYRIKHENLVNAIASSSLPLKHGDFTMTVFNNWLDNAEHFVLIKKPISKTPLVRIHSECITGDVFGSCKCDCGSQLDETMRLLSKEGGILIYLRQEGRGIGLANKLKAYELQDKGFDTVEANKQLGLPIDARNYAVAYQILKYLNIQELRLITNNPQKVLALEKYGINVCERLSVSIVTTKENRNYLKTKKEKLGHFLILENEE